MDVDKLVVQRKMKGTEWVSVMPTYALSCLYFSGLHGSYDGIVAKLQEGRTLATSAAEWRLVVSS